MRGRKRLKDPLIFHTVGLRASQWEWLDLWFPGASPTRQLQALFERSEKFWPAGPFVFCKGRKKNDEGDSL